MTRKKIISKENIIWMLLLFVFAALEFRVHRIIGFYADDLWYETNLVTGEKLKSLKDIWESQYWHFFNWGGRSVNHAVLQLVLMSGEVCADILNMLCQFLLSWLICRICQAKKLLSYLFVFAALIALNPEPILSMFWESGSVNYLYASIWVFAFAWLYIRELDEKSIKKLPFVEIWIIPLAVMTGWSNENIGPAMFLLSAGIILFNRLYYKKKAPFWMYEGSFFCLAGCIPMLLAPGNSVRGAYSSGGIWNRIENIFNATAIYIFPALIVTVFLILLYTVVFKKKLRPSHYAVIAYAIVSHGAMIVSPMYPSRPAFGIVAALLIVDASLIDEMLDCDNKCAKWIKMMAGFVILYGIVKLIGFYILPPV